MKMYKEEMEITADKEQIAAMEGAGWSRTKPDLKAADAKAAADLKAAEEKEAVAEKPAKKTKRRTAK